MRDFPGCRLREVPRIVPEGILRELQSTPGSHQKVVGPKSSPGQSSSRCLLTNVLPGWPVSRVCGFSYKVCNMQSAKSSDSGIGPYYILIKLQFSDLHCSSEAGLSVLVLPQSLHHEKGRQSTKGHCSTRDEEQSSYLFSLLITPISYSWHCFHRCLT